jgi:hypothetical protein
MTTTATFGGTSRIPISFEAWYGWLSSALGLTPSRSYVAVGHDEVEVRMGWAFRSRFPRSAIATVAPLDLRPLSRGVHGFGGRWLVNGSGRGILSIKLTPDQRAYVMGVPIRLRELMVSVGEPSRVATALGAGA